MSLITLCSAKGSPGVTTAAFALAGTDVLGGTALLVEADPAGGDLASRLGFPAEPGLASLAAAGRREFNAELIEHYSQRVAGIDVVAAPAGPSSARSALHVLGPGLALALRALAGRVVICDLGRLDGESASVELARSADLVLVVTRPVLADLAHVAEEGDWWGRLGPPVALVLSGEPGAMRRERYPAGEVSSALGLEVLGTLAWDPKGAAALVGQGRDGSRSALVQTARSLSAALVQRLPGAVTETAEVVEARLRGDLRSRVLDALVRLSQYGEDAGEPDRALAALDRSIAIDPYAEELYQRKLRLQAAAGRPDAVKRTLRELTARLDEIGVDPSEATCRIAKVDA